MKETNKFKKGKNSNKESYYKNQLPKATSNSITHEKHILIDGSIKKYIKWKIILTIKMIKNSRVALRDNCDYNYKFINNVSNFAKIIMSYNLMNLVQNK